MRPIALTIAFISLFCIPNGKATAQKHPRGSGNASRSDEIRPNCYDPADRSEIRLWDGRAPGAMGDDPCRDIPFLKLYSAGSEGRNTRTAIIVIPGGGYDHLSDKKEQGPVGEYFSRQLHMTTFVLFYRLVQQDGTYRYPIPMWDGQRALKLVRHQAASYGFSPDRVGLFGFSAGGHLASTLALHPASNFDLPQHDSVDELKGRPDFLGLGYPVISMLPNQYASPNSLGHLLYGYRGQELDHLEHYLSGQENVTPHVPPVFLFESLDDKQISSQNSVLLAQALHATNVPVDVHLFKHGVHGAGLAEDIAGEQKWPEMFHQWLVSQGFLR